MIDPTRSHPLRFLNHAELEQSSVVANCAMNRERRAVGVNSYARELGFDAFEFLERRLAQGRMASWLDLCCGAGCAVQDAATTFASQGLGADDQAGPNATGQNAVDSYYRREPRRRR